MPKDINFNDIFNDSYDYVLDHEHQFYDMFYHNFIQTSSLVGMVFENTDMENQVDMLKKAVAHMVTFCVTKKASKYLVSIALMHKYKIKVSPRLYDDFMSAIITTIAQFYPRYDQKCAIAWRITFAPGIEFMKHITDTDEHTTTE